jgi:hypothetical protein
MKETTAAPVDFGPVIAATRQLGAAVHALLACYESEERLNDCQPRAVGAIYAASLDEWAAAVPDAIAAWDEAARLAAEIEASRTREAEAEASRRAAVAEELGPLAYLLDPAGLNFGPELAGGGCVILSRYFAPYGEPGPYVWITCDGGGGFPDDAPGGAGWLVGVYNPAALDDGGEELALFSSEAFGPGALRAAAMAAVAICEKLASPAA